MYKIVILLFTFAVMCKVNALPRDSSVIKTESVSHIQDTDLLKEKEPQPSKETVLPGQLLCKYDKESEEPTEDPVCQEHCLPKGYSYGICVRGKCSCI